MVPKETAAPPVPAYLPLRDGTLTCWGHSLFNIAPVKYLVTPFIKVISLIDTLWSPVCVCMRMCATHAHTDKLTCVDTKLFLHHPVCHQGVFHPHIGPTKDSLPRGGPLWAFTHLSLFLNKHLQSSRQRSCAFSSYSPLWASPTLLPLHKA